MDQRKIGTTASCQTEKESKIKLISLSNWILLCLWLVSVIFLIIFSGFFGLLNRLNYLSDFVPRNSIYENIYDRSVCLTIKSKEKDVVGKRGGTSGTAWILDYEKHPSRDVQLVDWYPLTFYYATNLHVACLYDLNRCEISLKTGTIDPDGEIIKEHVIFPKEVRLIYTGLNFIKNEHLKRVQTSMKVYYTKKIKKLNFIDVARSDKDNHRVDIARISWLNKDFQSTATMFDFAVLRVVFKDNLDAIKATHYFANKGFSTKFWRHDLNYQATLTKKRWFIGGYPYRRWTINSIVNERRAHAFKGKKLTNAIATNSSYADEIFRSKTFALKQANTFFIPYGIQFEVTQSALGSGSSGSLVCDEENQLVGISWGRNKNKQTALFHVFINNSRYKMKVKNEYGEFEQDIVEYDLIHRNDYSTSYEEALRKKYPRVQTFLLGSGRRSLKRKRIHVSRPFYRI